MSLKINKIVFYFIIVCFISMTLPYVWDFGGGLFKKDFYAKRIMTLLTFPFFLLVLVFSMKKITTTSKNIILYLIIFIIVTVNSFFYNNKLSLIILDAFILSLPIFFYLLVYKTTFNKELFIEKIPHLLVIASVLTMSGIKLQFSYFPILAIIYIVFFSKINYSIVILLIVLPFLTVKTLIGKSSLIMLGLLFIYLMFINKTVNKQRQKLLVIIFSVLFFTGVSFFWGLISETGAYSNTVYFLRHADFSKFEFKDMSTGHRLYEAKQVLLTFENANWYRNIFGNGFGSTLDLSKSVDSSVINLHNDLSKVRHIHIGFFAVLHRFGFSGIIIYLLFIKKVFVSCKKVIKHTNDYKWILISLYLLILIFDSFITFPHMMSNFIFWLFVFMVFKKSREIKIV